MLEDPMMKLDPEQVTQLWIYRERFADKRSLLPRVLSCVDWSNAQQVNLAVPLLSKWAAPDHPGAYLALLGETFANAMPIRNFAVQRLHFVPDATFSMLLPQLVNALEWEPYLVSPLALLLIERAVANPHSIGVDFFWTIKLQSYESRHRKHLNAILQVFLDACDTKTRAQIEIQDQLFAADGAIDNICGNVKAVKNEGQDAMQRVAHDGLRELRRLPPVRFTLPTDTRAEVGRLLVQKCRVETDTSKTSLKLVFENAEE